MNEYELTRMRDLDARLNYISRERHTTHNPREWMKEEIKIVNEAIEDPKHLVNYYVQRDTFNKEYIMHLLIRTGLPAFNELLGRFTEDDAGITSEISRVMRHIYKHCFIPDNLLDDYINTFYIEPHRPPDEMRVVVEWGLATLGIRAAPAIFDITSRLFTVNDPVNNALCLCIEYLTDERLCGLNNNYAFKPNIYNLYLNYWATLSAKIRVVLRKIYDIYGDDHFLNRPPN